VSDPRRRQLDGAIADAMSIRVTVVNAGTGPGPTLEV
jgi:hypothetical protein